MIVKPVSSSGFTLTELLISIVIIGILSAIAIPSLLGFANRARESEARTYIGSINRSQQLRLVESQSFGTLEQLGNPIPTETENYRYAVTANESSAIITANPVGDGVRPMSGIIQIQTVLGTSATTTVTAICPGTLTPTIGCEQ